MKDILMEEQTNGMFWGQVEFLFFIFPHHRTLKILEMKYNPTNKK